MWATDGLSTCIAAQKCNRGTRIRICVRGDYCCSSHVCLQAAAIGVDTRTCSYIHTGTCLQLSSFSDVSRGCRLTWNSVSISNCVICTERFKHYIRTELNSVLNTVLLSLNNYKLLYLHIKQAVNFPLIDSF